MLLKNALVLCSSFVVLTTCQDHLDVRVEEQGIVRGFKDSKYGVYTFYNVPYAKAPTGKDKYKAPLPPKKWKDVFMAVNRGIACPQFRILPDNITISEDCLVANVYVPQTHQTNLPVVIFVHGGSFQLGYGARSEPKAFAKESNVVAVSFNYRLGINGFLCLGTEGAPGNAGFKDQVALLRWVHKNIANFGGNPHDVTVSGCSAGGAAVDLLILSKLTDGLMHKATPGSGGNIGPFAVQFDPLKNAQDLAISQNFTAVHDIHALTEFYESLSYEDLMKFQFLFNKDSSVTFSGCVEKYIGQEMFLEEAPLSILLSGNFKIMPMMYGFASFDGSIRYSVFELWQYLMNKNFADFLPADLEFHSEEEKLKVAEHVKEFYFGYQGVSNETVLSYLHYFTDTGFAQGMLRSADLQVKAGNSEIYFYEYYFTRSDMPTVPGRAVHGASHCFQLIAISDEDESVLPKNYVNLKHIMRALLNNFVKHGNPTPKGWSHVYPTWPPIGEFGAPYYSIGEIIDVKNIPIASRTAFWDNIYKKYYRMAKKPVEFLMPFSSNWHKNNMRW